MSHYLKFSEFLGTKLPRISIFFLSATTKNIFFASHKKFPVQEIRHHFSMFVQLSDNDSCENLFFKLLN